MNGRSDGDCHSFQWRSPEYLWINTSYVQAQLPTCNTPNDSNRPPPICPCVHTILLEDLPVSPEGMHGERRDIRPKSARPSRGRRPLLTTHARRKRFLPTTSWRMPRAGKARGQRWRSDLLAARRWTLGSTGQTSQRKHTRQKSDGDAEPKLKRPGSPTAGAWVLPKLVAPSQRIAACRTGMRERSARS